MLKCSKNDGMILHISILLLCLFPIVVSFLLLTDGRSIAIGIQNSIFEIRLPCFFKEITGYNCPVCGMTRTYTFMSGFDFHEAWHMNKAGVLLYVFCVLQVPYRLLLIIAGTIPFQKNIVMSGYAFLGVIIIVDLWQFITQFIR